MFFIIISALHVSGGFSAHHQELIKLYVQPWVLSCFPAVYRWYIVIIFQKKLACEKSWRYHTVCDDNTQGCTYSFISS